MRNSIQFPSQSLECCDISQRQLFPAFQTLLHPLAKLCGFIFHGTEKFGYKSISTAETGQKTISPPRSISPPHVVHSLAPVWIRIRYEPTDMFVFKHYALIGPGNTI